MREDDHNTQTKLKILCLHGYGTNREFMQRQTRHMYKDLAPYAQLIYVNSPYTIPLELVRDPKVITVLHGPPRQWYHQSYFHKTATEEQKLLSFREICDQFASASDSYDGVLGFSQGTAIFSVIRMYQQMGKFDHPILKKIKFFISASTDASFLKLERLNWQRVDLPSIHLISERDYVIKVGIWGPTLFRSSEVIFHGFGHRFPVLGVDQKRKLVEFVKKNGYSSIQTAPIYRQSKL